MTASKPSSLRGAQATNQSSLWLKHEFVEADRRDLPDGQISKILSSPLCKNNSLSPSGKSKLEVPPSCPEEGRWPSSRTLGWDAVDATAWRRPEIAGREEPRERSRRARRRMLFPASPE